MHIAALGFHHASCIAALAIELDAANGRVHLLPAGKFRAVDGRPENLDAWELTAAAAARIASHVSARQTPLVIDYEHQTLHARQNGQPAPAAGWFKAVQFDPAAGLSAVDVEWTDQARGFIAARQYRFASAVFSYDRESGEVRELLHAALTNNPGLDGLSEVTALAARHFSILPEDSMKQLLIAALALTATQIAAAKTDEDLIKLVADLRIKADGVAVLEAEVVQLKATQFDATRHAPLEQLTRLQGELQAALTQVNTFKSQAAEVEVAKLVEDGMAAGKIVAATKDYFTEMGKKDIAALKAYLDKQPAIEALATRQTGGKPPVSAVATFDAPPGATVDAERAALHSQAVDYMHKHKVDYLTAAKAVGVK